jgi:RimJ/RimL family protein N-acetyltransferase
MSAMSVGLWPRASTIKTQHLGLQPLLVEHVDEMFCVLNDPDLHQYTGGRPLSLDQLRARYLRQAWGHSPDLTQGWLNWIIRRLSDHTVLGTVQATLRREDGLLAAELAWVVGRAHQRQGYATEAAHAVLGWLCQHRVDVCRAHIHPEHEASIGVAKHLGFKPSDTVIDGETQWVLGRGRPQPITIEGRPNA